MDDLENLISNLKESEIKDDPLEEMKNLFLTFFRGIS